MLIQLSPSFTPFQPRKKGKIMKEQNEKRPHWGERIHAHLHEDVGAIFRHGKWRFWFPFFLAMTAINGLLTAWFFGGKGVFTFIGFIVATVGGLLCWIGVGNLHYSDSEDPQLALVVSRLDSATLCFVIAHFCFLLWACGHLYTVRGDESKYEAQAQGFNDKLKDFSSDNVKIAQADADAARDTAKAARLQNDTAYQIRKASEAGAHVPALRPSAGGSASLHQTAPIEMLKPEKPKESSSAFMAMWEIPIRLANFGELALAAITLIYIRTRSAKVNSIPRQWDIEAELGDVVAQNARRSRLEAHGATIPPVATHAARVSTSQAALRASDARKTASVATEGGDWREIAVRKVRGHLGVISEGLPGRWFKADLIKPEGVWIRIMGRNGGEGEKTLKKTRQSDKLLMAVDRPDFRERLIDELIHQGFPVRQGGVR